MTDLDDEYSSELETWPCTIYRSREKYNGSRIRLRIAERQSGGTHCRVWRAARLLCRFLEQAVAGKVMPSLLLHGCKVLELGAGPGLPGILSAHLGADVTITDLANVLPIIRHNVQVNGVGADVATGAGSARVDALPWGEDVREKFPRAYFDVIIGSDMTWLIKWDGPLLLCTLLQLVDANTKILFSFTHRPYQLQGWRELFEPYFSLEVIDMEDNAEPTNPASDEEAGTLELQGQSTLLEEKDPYSLKYFDDSGDEGKTISILNLRPILPLPSDSVVKEMLASLSTNTLANPR